MHKIPGQLARDADKNVCVTSNTKSNSTWCDGAQRSFCSVDIYK